ncbi:MAG: mRNA surveillance protein pelota [Methanobacteriota archaeon]
MKIISMNPRHGKVSIRVDSLDDLWYLSQVVIVGDLVKSKSVRRIKDKEDKLRSGGGERKTITITVKVEKKEFKSDDDSLRFSGVIESGPEDLVSLGSHHTVNVEKESVLTVIKDKWSKIDLDRIKDAEKSTLKPKFLVVIVDEGEATFGLVRESKIEYSDLRRNVGGKYDIKDRESRKMEFYSEVSDIIQNTSGKDGVSNVILAGPGFEKENFFNFISEKNISRINFLVENTGSSGRRAVSEVLKRSTVHKLLAQLNSSQDIQLVEQVLERIGKDDGLAAYGLPEVFKATSMGAVEKLLVSDTVFMDQRKVIEPIMLDVKARRGLVHILNHDSEAGQQLDSLGGIAALLRFRIQ